MTDKLQQKIPGITTSSPPTATSLASRYVLAWTNDNAKATISWAEVGFDKDKNANISGSIKDTGFSTQSGGGFGPALTNFNGTLWMAFLEDPAQAPWIPSFPENQRRQPPVIMASSFNGTKWSQPQPLWDPGLTGTDQFVPSYQGPAAITAPAIAANGSEIMVVWVENAVNGSDALALWSGGQLASPPAQPQIFYSKWTSAGGWTQRSAVKGALTQATPALAVLPTTAVLGALGGTFCMAWQGHSDGNIWFAQYTDGGGWSEAAKLPVFETSAGPALAADAVGNLQLVWKGRSDSKLYLATLGGNTGWSPTAPGAGWSPQRQLPVVATSVQPALAPQLATSAVLMAFKGATGADLWVAPLPAFYPANIGVKMQYQESSEWCWIAMATSINHFYNSGSTLTQCALMTTVGHSLNKFPSNTSACPTAAAIASVPGLAGILASPYQPNAYAVLDNTSLNIPTEYLKTGGVGDALKVKGNANTSTANLIPLAQIQSEIRAGRPVVVDIAWGGPAGPQHDVAIAGFQDDLLLICDPIFGESAIEYGSFPSLYQGGATVNSTFLTKKGS